MQKQILEKSQIDRMIQRLAYQLIEENVSNTNIVLAGVQPGGVILAKQLKFIVEKESTIQCKLTAISLNKKQPDIIKLSEENIDENETVIIVDDVSMTGKTICYSMLPFLEKHPQKLQTLVLVEREQKLFPIASNYVGMHVSTTLQDLIIVETDGEALLGAYLK